MFYFYTPRNHQKTFCYDVLRGYRSGTLGWYRLKLFHAIVSIIPIFSIILLQIVESIEVNGNIGMKWVKAKKKH